MKYSVIVAVYNRPDEMRELLDSLARQTNRDFEVVVVEDGSAVTSENVCRDYAAQLAIHYYAKSNTGPGQSRNYGCRRASGDYFIFLDSDCTVPPEYMAVIDAAVEAHHLDAFGGPDRDHVSFSTLQRAISHSMTSLLTTGGIRGKALRIGGAFHPRSFNMGISRDVFNATDGFSSMRFGEDVDLSLRIIAHGFRTALIPEAWVYHKRRSTLTSFYKQVHQSGRARIDLTLRHPGSLKLTHFFPAAFTTYVAFSAAVALTHPMGVATLLPVGVYLLLVGLEGALRTRSAICGALSMVTTIVQHTAYGLGFARGIVERIILGRPEQKRASETFYS
jgi:glycosyltransferase involved in cell wall biosynthesis